MRKKDLKNLSSNNQEITKELTQDEQRAIAANFF